MFLYSDALIETPGKSMPPLEDVGLLDLVGRAASRDDGGAELEAVLNEFFHRSVSPIPDDLTAVWLQRNIQNEVSTIR